MALLLDYVPQCVCILAKPGMTEEIVNSAACHA